MTDKLILTPNHFSVESGFQSGVVVDICSWYGRTVGVFAAFDPLTGYVIVDTGTGNKDILPITSIKSISVLTGPMRFWAGAPEWAKVCVETTATGKVEFYAIDYGITLGGSERRTDRPFWCDFGKEAEG